MRRKKAILLLFAIEVPVLMAFSWAIVKHPGQSHLLAVIMACFMLLLLVGFTIIFTLAARRDKTERIATGKQLPMPKPFVIAISAIWGFLIPINMAAHLNTMMQLGKLAILPTIIGLLISGAFLYTALTLYLRRKRMLANNGKDPLTGINPE